MRQANRLVLIICLITVEITIAMTHIVPSLSENPRNQNGESDKLFVQVIGGNNEQLAGQTLAAEWIIQATSQLGSPYAWEKTDWVELTQNKQEIYTTMMGGRLIEARLLPKEKPEQVTVEITGFKIGTVPRLVTLQRRDGVRELIKLTNYPGERNVFLGIRIGQVTNHQP